MPALIHNASRFHKKLEAMHKAGGKARDAADQALAIVSELASRKHLTPQAGKKLTRHGEARIESCGKFNLGGGYRLIFVKQDDCFVFLYLGSHDECDTWINNHRGFKPDIKQTESVEVFDDSEPQAEKDLLADEPLASTGEDTPLHEVIDQQTLREIFPGICGEK
jgi:hypothetical protein